MRKIPISLLLVIPILLTVGIIYISVDKPILILYDCNIAEVTKDVPENIKEHCRKKTQNDNR